MSVSSAGVYNKANTSDGRAMRVHALNSGASNSVGGRGAVDRFGSQPTPTHFLIAQDGDYLTTEGDDRLITQN